MIEARKKRQEQVEQLVREIFGDDEFTVQQRGLRHVEEAIEVAQSCGADRDMVHKLVDYVYSRPVGDLAQEIGGSGVTLLALAAAARMNADLCEALELSRIESIPKNVFVERNNEKNAKGFTTLSIENNSVMPEYIKAQRRANQVYKALVSSRDSMDYKFQVMHDIAARYCTGYVCVIHQTIGGELTLVITGLKQ